MSAPSHPDPATAAWLGALAERSRLARDQARWAESAALATLGLAEAIRRGEGQVLPDFLNLLGSVAFQRGEMDRARDWFTKAMETAARGGDASRRAAALVNLGAIANVQGRFRQALLFYRRGWRSYRRARNPAGEARALHNMGILYADLERWHRAELCYRRALRRAAAGEDPLLSGIIALNASAVHLALGQLELARRVCDEAADRLIAMEAWAGVADVDLRYGEIFRRMGRPGLAREHLRRAARLSRELGSPLSEAEALRAMGQVQAEGELLEEALECYGRALSLFRSLDAGHELAESVIVEIVETLSRRIEASDPHLFGHSARVARYAVDTAARMGFARDELVALLVAGYIHEIGKLRVEPELLGRPGRLTREERERVQRHSAEGAEQVARFELPWEVAPVLRAQHEDYDGRGFPGRLTGEAIPLAARILRAADVYDALVSPRPWREAWSHEDAVAYFELSAGQAFDPAVVEVLLDVVPARTQDVVAAPHAPRLSQAIADLAATGRAAA